MNRRRTRYVILGYFADGRMDDCLQANSRRKDALKRAASIAANHQDWPGITRVVVRDTMPEMIDGHFVHIIANHVR